MKSQVARIQQSLAVGLNQKRRAVEGGMIHRIGGYLKVPDGSRFAGDDGLLPGFIQFDLPGKNCPGQQHFARALGAIDRDFRINVIQQSGMVSVRVGNENGLHQRPGLKQSRYFWHTGRI